MTPSAPTITAVHRQPSRRNRQPPPSTGTPGLPR